jgi:hypothetical protein
MEAFMSHKKKITKLDERREMQKLMRQRADRTPDRPLPGWILSFWNARRRMPK